MLVFFGIFYRFYNRLLWPDPRLKNRQKSTGKKLFYRFYDPEEEAFPYMIELFSRKPDVFELPLENHLSHSLLPLFAKR